MSLKIAVIGAGSWGLTLAQVFHGNKHKITVWEFSPKQAQILKHTRKFEHLPEINLPYNINISSDLSEVIKEAQIAVIAVPSIFMRETVKKLARLPLKNDLLILCATKGLEDKTFKTMSRVITEELPDHFKKNIAVMSGPNIAKEIAASKPAATVIACQDIAKARFLQKTFMTNYLRIYTSMDVAGTELGGAIKNVIAIACGICDGLDLGTNAKSALITRGLAEIGRLGKFFKAQPETFAGLSGLGDLITTCYSPFSRNRRCGELIARGKTYKQALKEICTVVEGIQTCQAVYHFTQKYKISMPISEQVYQVLLKGKSPRKAVLDLMTRQAKQELT